MAEKDKTTDSHEDKEQEDYKSKYLYLLAEMDNYRKTKDKESAQSSRYASEKLITDLLKVLDDFESVMKMDKDEKIAVLFKSLYSVLSSYGLQKMEVLGKDYTPELAEAVATEKVQEGAGKIIEEIQAGYTLNGKVIRYPKVKISI